MQSRRVGRKEKKRKEFAREREKKNSEEEEKKEGGNPFESQFDLPQKNKHVGEVEEERGEGEISGLEIL